MQCEQRGWQSVNRPNLPQPPTVNAIGRPMHAHTHSKPCNDSVPGSRSAQDQGRTTSSCYNHAVTSAPQQGSVFAVPNSKRPMKIHAKGKGSITSTPRGSTIRVDNIIVIEDEEPSPASASASTSERVHVTSLEECQGSAAWAMAICTRTSRVDPEELWRAQTGAEIQALFGSEEGPSPAESPNHAIRWAPLRQPKVEASEELPGAEEESIPAWRSASSERSILNLDE